MKIRNSLLLFSFIFITDNSAFAQGYRDPNIAGNEDKFSINYGLRLGYTYKSSISNIGTTILSEPFFIDYTLTEIAKNGWWGGAYASYRFLNDYMALQGEINYSQQGSELKFVNTQKDFSYNMQFKYQYINIHGMLKIYPCTGMMSQEDNYLYGLYIGAGPQLGLNIAPQNIIYTSGGTGRLPSFGTDLEQQQQLRNVLKGKTNFGFNIGAGYEFKKIGLVFDARYFIGITDVVETMANSYNFIENKNTNRAFQFSIGWDFSFFNKSY